MTRPPARLPEARLGEAVRTALAPGVARRLLAALERRWGGTRFYLPLAAARLTWRGAEPRGAAERFAADVVRETGAAGGSRRDAELLLLSLAGHRISVAWRRGAFGENGPREGE